MKYKHGKIHLVVAFITLLFTIIPLSAADLFSRSIVQGVMEQLNQVATQMVLTTQEQKSFGNSVLSNENNWFIRGYAKKIVMLSSDAEQNTADILEMLDTMNTRIDNSEETTLELATDIGLMADRILIMAGYILLTEQQIGVMADRIVESEYLISDSSLELASMISDQSTMAGGLVASIIDLAGELVALLDV